MYRAPVPTRRSPHAQPHPRSIWRTSSPALLHPSCRCRAAVSRHRHRLRCGCRRHDHARARPRGWLARTPARAAGRRACRGANLATSVAVLRVPGLQGSVLSPTTVTRPCRKFGARGRRAPGQRATASAGIVRHRRTAADGTAPRDRPGDRMMAPMHDGSRWRARSRCLRRTAGVATAAEIRGLGVRHFLGYRLEGGGGSAGTRRHEVRPPWHRWSAWCHLPEAQRTDADRTATTPSW